MPGPRARAKPNLCTPCRRGCVASRTRQRSPPPGPCPLRISFRVSSAGGSEATRNFLPVSPFTRLLHSQAKPASWPEFTPSSWGSPAAPFTGPMDRVKPALGADSPDQPEDARLPDLVGAPVDGEGTVAVHRQVVADVLGADDAVRPAPGHAERPAGHVERARVCGPAAARHGNRVRAGAVLEQRNARVNAGGRGAEGYRPTPGDGDDVGVF